MIRRRFLNLVVENYRTGERSLHRLDAAKHLFYPSTAKAEAAHAKVDSSNGVPKLPRIVTLRQLPPPIMRLEGFPATADPWLLDDTFVLLSRPRAGDDHGGRILHTSSESGRTHLYNADAGSTITVPTIKQHKGPKPIVILAGAGAEEEGKERVYALSNYCNDHSFEVLDLSRHPHKWEPLPLPPYAKSFGTNIGSFTVVDGGSTICISSKGNGTYCFDTRSHEWWHAGDWVLPFFGQADHVPELGTWLGFRHCLDPMYLCASSDLLAMDADEHHRREHELPELQHVWEDFKPPASEDELLDLGLLGGIFAGTVLTRTTSWNPGGQNLVNLGGGRFCIAKVFRVEQTVRLYFEEGGTAVGDMFVVLIGVEVIRLHGDGGEEGGLRMVKHESRRYVFKRERIRCVL